MLRQIGILSLIIPFSAPLSAKVARVTTAVATAAVLVPAIDFATRSAFLGWELARPRPFWDHWHFVLDYFDYIDGKYDPSRLFAFHNEHRIFTSRLFYFADAILFKMSGALLIVTIYTATALTAVVMAAIITKETRWALLPWVILLIGLLWSVAQWETLAWGFLTQFPLMHLFALLTLQSLALALTGATHRSLWLITACVLDFLCIFSLGTGVMVGGGAVALAVWLKKFNHAVGVFLVIHIALSAIALSGFHSGNAPVAPIEYLKFALLFLGSAFRGWQSITTLAGVVVFAATVGLASVTTWLAVVQHKSADCGVAVLLALSLIVVAEALAASFTRAQIGLGQAVVPRYAGISLIR